MTQRTNLSVILVCLFFLGACTSFWQLGQPQGTRDGVSSSLVDYLYPKGEIPPEQPQGIPRLKLPLRAGIAFVPGRHSADSTISEATRTELLGNVKSAFVDRDYIAHIEVIPDTYLRSSSGFDGMQQVARLYGVDIMALVSYDQVAVSEDRKASILYWTIVGAYIIKGTENEVQTFVDTAVFDVATRRLLFRAPGTDKLQMSSTAIETGEAVRKGRTASFAAAVGNMTGNLLGELDKFELRLKEEPQLAEVSWNEPKGGGGSVGVLTLMVLLFSSMARHRNGRNAAAKGPGGPRPPSGRTGQNVNHVSGIHLSRTPRRAILDPQNRCRAQRRVDSINDSTSCCVGGEQPARDTFIAAAAHAKSTASPNCCCGTDSRDSLSLFALKSAARNAE